MKKTIFNVFLFAAGAAVGSLVTWKVVKTKYERIAQEEIESVKETWDRISRMESGELAPYDEDEYCEEDDEDDEDESDMSTYRDLVHNYEQSGDEAENDGEGAGNGEVPYVNGPYVITPEDFGDGNFEHSLYSLTYYSDGILADDWLVELNIDETIGEDSLEHFGDYADDIVHVRNERLNADYEVVKDPRLYSEMVANESLMHAYANRGSC